MKKMSASEKSGPPNSKTRNEWKIECPDLVFWLDLMYCELYLKYNQKLLGCNSCNGSC